MLSSTTNTVQLTGKRPSGFFIQLSILPVLATKGCGNKSFNMFKDSKEWVGYGHGHSFRYARSWLVVR